MQVTPPLHLRAEDGARIELDLRHLPSPEPMLRALAAADALQPGQSVHVLTPLLPIPLLDALASRGLHTSAVTLPGGTARVWIHRQDDDGPTGA
jgi:uncharacterized protein (DUF2249 family)